MGSLLDLQPIAYTIKPLYSVAVEEVVMVSYFARQYDLTETGAYLCLRLGTNLLIIDSESSLGGEGGSDA